MARVLKRGREQESLLDVRVARPSLLLGAMPLIARWHRRRSAGVGAPLACPGPVSATSRLKIISQTEEGARFLCEATAELESAALEAHDPEEASSLLGTAATLAWATGDLTRAHTNACGALSACRETGDNDSLCEVKSLLVRLERQMEANCPGRMTSQLSAVVEVDRVRADELSVLEFLTRYAIPRRPVIFEGLGEEVVRDAPFRWSLSEWREMLRNPEAPPTPAQARLRLAAARAVRLKRKVSQSSEWARLEDAPQAAGPGTTLGDVIEQCGGGADVDYLFDWSLQCNCPELLAGLRIPRYFANDLLQSCAAPGALYRDTWPSLFIGPADSSCGLHVDTFGSHFWCALLDGRKRWAFFPAEQAGALGVDFSLSADGTFDTCADAFVDGLHAAPLEQLLRTPASVEVLGSQWARSRCLSPMVCELRPGDALFVPSGMPHAVRNVGGPALSLSANYIDGTNLAAALTELELAALTDERALALAAQLRAHAVGPRAGSREGGMAALYDIGDHVSHADFKRGDPSAGGRWPALDHATVCCEAVRQRGEHSVGASRPVATDRSSRPLAAAQPARTGAMAAARRAVDCTDVAPFAFDPDELSD